MFVNRISTTPPATSAPDRLPFAVNGDVVSEPMGGVLIRDGRCARCGRHVMASDT